MCGRLNPTQHNSTFRPPGSIPLFRVAGITIHLHFLWAIVAAIQIPMRRDDYSNPIWPTAEYLALFVIVLLHEFGHAIACRSVGGRADTILLWPFGGIAYVQPPMRPLPYLWTIVAGPLVNAALLLPTIILARPYWNDWGRNPIGDVGEFTVALAIINAGLLAFNLLPIFPLDGGQILRGLLWLFVGPIHSMLVAATIGLLASAAGALIALRFGALWLALMAAYAATQSWLGLMRVKAAYAMIEQQRRMEAAQTAVRDTP